MGPSEQFSRADLLRILNVSEKQLGQWEKWEFVPALHPGIKDSYDFRDLISVRTAKQLIENGVSPDRLRRSLQALQQKLSETRTPLSELHIVSNGKDVLVESAGKQLEPLSGQFILNFKTRELCEKVLSMPEPGAASVFDLALEYDADASTRNKAADTYERVLALDPLHVDALLNRGMIAYEQADLETAVDYFRRAVHIQPENPVALFNLGSTLDELGLLPEARLQLRLATRLDPSYADAHYNLAIVCDKLHAESEARDHWSSYLNLDPAGMHADYARARLNTRATR
ncbi:MAG: tetratricopeptide repeat protein [Acidipila sp.]|nr:tetratricopeptide repeat protein [Acidipila sp.]